MKIGAAQSVASERVSLPDVAAVLARWLLGAIFVYMGLSKAMHPVEFLKLLRQYDVLHAHVLLNLVASTLPWVEIFCGLLLIAGVALRGAATVILVMVVAFTLAVVRRTFAIQDASGLPFCAIKFDCGCGAGEILICRKLVENLFLAALSTAVILFRERRLCLRYSVF